jgi:hypothetical protein
MPGAAGLIRPGRPWTVAWVSARLSPFRRCRRRGRSVPAIGFKARYAQRLGISISLSTSPDCGSTRRTVTQRARAISSLGPTAAARRRSSLALAKSPSWAWQWRSANAGGSSRNAIRFKARCQGAGACCDQSVPSNPDTLVTPSGGLAANISTSRSTAGRSRPIRQ